MSTAVLGFNEFEINSSIKIYPNPASNNITLEMLTNENSNLEVYDVFGKLLLKQVLNKKINTVNIDNLNSGVYLFKVNSSEGSSINKILKN